MKTMQQLTRSAMDALPDPFSARSENVEGVATVTCPGCMFVSTEICSVQNLFAPGEKVKRLCAKCEHESRVAKFDVVCPPLYRECDPKLLPPGSAAHLETALQWKFGPRGLLLTGVTNKGKSRIAWQVIRAAFIERPLSFRFFDCIAFGHEIARHYRAEDCEEWLEKLAALDLIFFDDLGKLKMTERAEAELFGLIERRTANMLPIIATTNDTGETLAARMTEQRGPAFVRRLRDFNDVIQF